MMALQGRMIMLLQEEIFNFYWSCTFFGLSSSSFFIIYTSSMHTSLSTGKKPNKRGGFSRKSKKSIRRRWKFKSIPIHFSLPLHTRFFLLSHLLILHPTTSASWWKFHFFNFFQEYPHSCVILILWADMQVKNYRRRLGWNPL